jgi:magnesium transporter
MARTPSTTQGNAGPAHNNAAREPQGGERHAPDAERKDGKSAFLYDADGDDHEVALDESVVRGLADDDLLWIDLRTPEGVALELLNGLFATEIKPLPPAEEATPRPFIRDYGEYFVLRVLPLRSAQGDDRAETLTCAVGRNWLATVHDGDVPSLEHFSGHLRGDSLMGRLDAPSFLARLLEWVVNDYFDELDRLQNAIDELEERILRERERTVIERLVSLRHDVGRLRRRLSPHRQVFATLSHPSFDVISGSAAAREFAILSDRLETAVQTVDTTREMVVGAFDLFMTQTAQRTNDVMRILTIVSLLLLPAALIAGTLGMNMLPKYLLASWVFWVALAGMVLVSGSLLLVMRLRRWL